MWREVFLPGTGPHTGLGIPALNKVEQHERHAGQGSFQLYLSLQPHSISVANRRIHPKCTVYIVAVLTYFP